MRSSPAHPATRSRAPRRCARRTTSTSGWPTASWQRDPTSRRRGERPMAATETTTYEAAVERLELIIARLDSNQAGLRETLDLCTEGRALIEYAAGELEAVGAGLRELRLDDLIARLEAGGQAPGAPGAL